MRKIVAAVAGVVVFTLSACGGGGGGGSADASTKTTAKTVTIEYVGDSTTVGCTVEQGAPRGPQCLANYAEVTHKEPATVEYVLARGGFPALQVINSGVAGTTVSDLLNGTRKVPSPWWPYVNASKAQLIVIQYGLNDAYQAGMTPELFAAELDQVISAAKAAGKHVVLETPNPTTNDHAPFLAQLVESEKAVAAKWGITVIDQFGYLSSLPTWPSMLSDGTHPTEAGYEVKGQYAATILAPIVKSLM